MRTFVRLRHLLAAREEIDAKLDSIEWRRHEQGQQIRAVFDTIDTFMQPPGKDVERRHIGFPLTRTNALAAGSWRTRNMPICSILAICFEKFLSWNATLTSRHSGKPN